MLIIYIRGDSVSGMKKVLILDDDIDIVEVIQIILDSAGYQVHGIYTGEGLMDVISEFGPDLIMLDVMLGPLDGRDLCNLLKNNVLTKHIPVLMISASHGIIQLSEKKCTPDEFIAKPFDIDHLLAKVNNLIA
jgi:DNA-binding response OmpR family regulator